jgi:hypothetical protein
MRQVQRDSLGDTEGAGMTCNCHPDSPFLWARDPRPSIFAKDIAFRAKTPQTYDNLTKEENVIAYKQFSIHSRAHPKVKPSKNKHEL